MYWIPSELQGEGLKQTRLPSADPVSHESEWNPSVICLQSGQQDAGHCHGDQDMLNRLHTHAAFAVGSWMQALNFGILPEGRQKTTTKITGKCQLWPPGKVLQRTALMLSRIIKSTLSTKEVPCKTPWAQLTWHSIPAGNWAPTKYFRRTTATSPVISLHQIRVSTKLFFTYHTTLPAACWHIAGIERGAGEVEKEVGTTPVSVTDSAQLNHLLHVTGQPRPYLCLFLFCSDFFHFHQDLLRLINIPFSSQLFSFS